MANVGLTNSRRDSVIDWWSFVGPLGLPLINGRQCFRMNFSAVYLITIIFNDSTPRDYSFFGEIAATPLIHGARSVYL